MTEEEARKTLKAAFAHVPGLNPTIIRYACPGGFAVVKAVQEDLPSLYFILTDYHVNIFEDLRDMGGPPIVSLPSGVLLSAPEQQNDWCI